MNKEFPKTEYDRLLFALGLEQQTEHYRSFLTEASALLQVSMSRLSDCVRRGRVVTEPVLEAAKAKGINPEFIKNGREPIYPEVFSPLR